MGGGDIRQSAAGGCSDYGNVSAWPTGPGPGPAAANVTRERSVKGRAGTPSSLQYTINNHRSYRNTTVSVSQGLCRSNTMQWPQL